MLITQIKRKEFEFNKNYGYRSQAEVARKAVEYIYGAKKSISTKPQFSVEYGGRLYFDSDTGRYHFTAPTEGRWKYTDVGNIPKDTKDAGIYHSHPGMDEASFLISPEDEDLTKQLSISGRKFGWTSRNYMLHSATGALSVHSGGRGETETLEGLGSPPKITVELPYYWKRGAPLKMDERDKRKFYASPFNPNNRRQGEINDVFDQSKMTEKNSVFDKQGNIKPEYR